MKWIIAPSELDGMLYVQQHNLPEGEYRVITRVNQLPGTRMRREDVVFFRTDLIVDSAFIAAVEHHVNGYESLRKGFEPSTRRSNVPNIEYRRSYLGSGYSGEPIEASKCLTCGALTEDQTLHTKWHQDLVGGNSD